MLLGPEGDCRHRCTHFPDTTSVRLASRRGPRWRTGQSARLPPRRTGLNPPAAGRRAFSGSSTPLPPPCIPAMPHSRTLNLNHATSETENLPRRRYRGANPQPFDYKSATLLLSYDGRPTRLPPGEPGSIPGGVRMCESCPDDAAVRRVFLGDLPFPPPLHSGAAPYTPRFSLIGSQELDVHIYPNLFANLNERGRASRKGDYANNIMTGNDTLIVSGKVPLAYTGQQAYVYDRRSSDSMASAVGCTIPLRVYHRVCLQCLQDDGEHQLNS
ncbi:hypothetical protein PR048_009732 [Dryococelus australis]|uniref:Uncharacterized protein n=1 Tax=Dryococelus australis TaxID=614101 RepID=A0ABQ9I0T0_9NEOP|nr:hypothetical protein PR048_009732 [Dryococelus australis]